MTFLCKTDGEWCSIIFNSSDNKRYVLHPVDFAYENHTQIISLLLETYNRLVLLNNDKQRTVAKELWEKTMIIMIDSVDEEPEIEKGIATALGSNHIPLDLLCKVYTVEALNTSNINVLASLESSLKFREAPESINACVKSFVRGEKLQVLYAIKSTNNFASHDKSSSPTNRRELIDYVLQRENKVKHLSLYQERRFTKLGLLLCLNTWCYALYLNGFNDADQALPADEKELQCRQICVTLWNEAETKTWDIDYCVEVLSDEFRVEYIHKVTKRSNLKWRYPTGSDITVVEPDQILNCAADGKWNILSNRNSEFLFWNHQTIHKFWKSCRHFLMYNYSLFTIHFYFLAVIFIVLKFISWVVFMVFHVFCQFSPFFLTKNWP